MVEATENGPRLTAPMVSNLSMYRNILVQCTMKVRELL